MASISQVANAAGDVKIAVNLNAILQAFLVDTTELRTKLAAAVVDIGVVRTALNTAITKLNADDGVNDTNYAAAAALTVTAPAALTVTA